MQVHIRGDRAHFAAEARDLVCKHARGGGLDRVVPVVVVVAQGVREVQDRHLRDVRAVLSHVEVGRFHATLRNRVRHQEEIELSIYYLRLFYEALVNIGTLGRVVDEGVAALVGLLEESLADALIHDDQSDFRQRNFGLVLRSLEVSILLVDDLVQLFKFEVDHLLSHRVAHTISVDEDMGRHLAAVILPVALE